MAGKGACVVSRTFYNTGQRNATANGIRMIVHTQGVSEEVPKSNFKRGIMLHTEAHDDYWKATAATH